MTPRFTPLVESLPSTIPFVAPEAIERQLGVRFTARLGANESAFGISTRAAEALFGALQKIPHYGDPENRQLREALAEKHQVGVNNISVGAGIDDLLGLTVRVFLDNTRVAVASLGSYGVFHYHVAGYGGNCRTLPYQSGGYNDLDGLAALACEAGASLVYLSNPDNPAGTCFPAVEIRNFVNKLPANCLCILDEAYIEFAPADTAFSLGELDPRVIQMRTFSKAHGLAGLRTGYAIASAEVVRAFDKVRLHFNVNKMAQTAAYGSLQDPEFVHQVAKQVETGRREYAALGESLGLPTLPSATNFITFDAGTQPRAQAILDALARHGIFIRKPGAPPLDRCFRVTVGTPEERNTYAEVLPRVLLEVDQIS